MIDQIFWHYIRKGVHLVIFNNGREKLMTSLEISETFSLGQLRRIGA